MDSILHHIFWFFCILMMFISEFFCSHICIIQSAPSDILPLTLDSGWRWVASLIVAYLFDLSCLSFWQKKISLLSEHLTLIIWQKKLLSLTVVREIPFDVTNEKERKPNNWTKRKKRARLQTLLWKNGTYLCTHNNSVRIRDCQCHQAKGLFLQRGDWIWLYIHVIVHSIQWDMYIQLADLICWLVRQLLWSSSTPWDILDSRLL